MKTNLLLITFLLFMQLNGQVTASKLIDIEAGVLVRPMTTEFKNYNFIYLQSPEDKYINFKKNRTAPGIYLKIDFNLAKDKLFFTYKGTVRYGHLYYDYSKFDTTQNNGMLPSVNGVMFDNILGLKYTFNTKIGKLSAEAGIGFINKRGTEFDYYKKNQTGSGYTVYGNLEVYDRRIYIGCSYQPIGRLTGSLYAMYGTRDYGQYYDISTLFLELNLGYRIFQ